MNLKLAHRLSIFCLAIIICSLSGCISHKAQNYARSAGYRPFISYRSWWFSPESASLHELVLRTLNLHGIDFMPHVRARTTIQVHVNDIQEAAAALQDIHCEAADLKWEAKRASGGVTQKAPIKIGKE
jgi:hypothetical protein